METYIFAAAIETMWIDIYDYDVWAVKAENLTQAAAAFEDADPWGHNATKVEDYLMTAEELAGSEKTISEIIKVHYEEELEE